MKELAYSVLSVPGHLIKMHKKAFTTKANIIQFDLEDSVPAEEKENARNLILETLKTSWEQNVNSASISVRLNPPSSPHFMADMRWFFMNQIFNELNYICLPKVEKAHEILFFQEEIAKREVSIDNKKLKFMLTIETAKGLANIEKIAEAVPNVFALVFGIADYTRSLGMEMLSLSGHGDNDDHPDYGYRFAFAISKIVNTAKAHGYVAIDAPYGDLKNIEGLRKSCERAKHFGMDGKWVIHPDQIDTVHEVFTHTEEQIALAEKVVHLYENKDNPELGAISIEGQMIDEATYQLAKSILNTVRL